jgi:hypothetical protein
MKRIHIEPLEGEERVRRSILDWVSEVVLVLARARTGRLRKQRKVVD